MWQHRLRRHGLKDFVLSLPTAWRTLLCYPALQRLCDSDLAGRLGARDEAFDPLFAVSHRHFLAQDLPLSARANCAAAHFRFEGLNYARSYRDLVYGADGMELWRAEVEGRLYTIQLHDSGKDRHEGPLSLELLADGRTLHVISLAWVPSASIGWSGCNRWVMFVTRNQSAPASSAHMARFAADFPQNAPSYFCMAALLGLAQANGHAHIAAVKSRAQIAFQSELSDGFRRSYEAFWSNFGGHEVTASTLAIPVPVVLPQLEEVKAKHRARARARRAHWECISRQVTEVVRAHRLPGVPECPAGVTSLLSAPLYGAMGSFQVGPELAIVADALNIV